MKKRKSLARSDLNLEADKSGASTMVLIVDTPRATISSKAMCENEAASIRDMLVEKFSTLSSLLIATETGDVIVGGDALRQSIVRFQTIAGNEDAMATLLVQVNAILSDSTHPLAPDFDSAGWLQQWVRSPQPSLFGVAPIDLIQTEEGLARVQRILAASVTGAYL